MIGTGILLLYLVKTFSLSNHEELYVKVLEALTTIQWSTPPDIYLTLSLSLALLVPLFFITTYMKTPDNPYEGEHVLSVAAHIVLYGFIIAGGCILLGEHKIMVAPRIYLVVLAVKFYEQYSLADFGVHAHKFLKNIGIGILAALVLAAAFLFYGGLFGSPEGITVKRVCLTFVLTFPMTLLNAFWEELLFRGYLQTKVEKIINGRTALFFQAVSYSVVYVLLQAQVTIQFFVFAVLFALVMGYLYYRTKSLVPGTAAHMISAAVVVPIYVQFSRDFTVYDWNLDFLFRVGILVLFFVVCEFYTQGKAFLKGF